MLIYYFVLKTWQGMSIFFLSLDDFYLLELNRYVGDGGFLYFTIYYFTFLVFIFLSGFIFSSIDNSRCYPLLSSGFLVGGGRDDYIVLFIIFLFFLCVACSYLVYLPPFFTGMQKHEYLDFYPNTLYFIYSKYQTFIAFILGLVFFRLSVAKKKVRFSVILLFLSFFLLILAGNKFSAIFNQLFFFLIPASLVMRGRSLKGFYFLSFGVVVLAALSLFLGVKVMMDVKGLAIDEALHHFVQRVFVQQGQIFTGVIDRVYLEGAASPLEALNEVFLEPIVHSVGHTSILFLMHRELGGGVFGAIEAGSQYTGAFPGIFFELFGGVGGWGAFILYTIFTLYVIKCLLYTVLRGHFLIAIGFLFVTQPILLSYISGKFVFLLSFNYYLKILLFFIVLLSYKLSASPRVSMRFN
ncbi:hypothetical protein Marme_0623 [Marinomonas mediterranea MMB-1]|uniref:O-antigen polymerase n=2 Tax=Marinomonas mediterranea TaxID=119864 RepID=F2K167_MARM1|nr:hypothetical protein Marme_0623 [Marinomonas mediterranea MMB-1]